MLRQTTFFSGNKKTIIVLVGQLLVIVAIPVIYFKYPVNYVDLIAEDNWGEYTTFVSFLFTSIFLTMCIAQNKVKKQQFWYILLAVGSFLVAMEEISWGQRVLGIPTPGVLQQVNLQKELTFHNIPALSPDSLTYLVVSIGLMLYGFFLPVFVMASERVRSIVEFTNFPLPKLYLAPLFLAAAFFLSFSPLVKSDELGEMFLGLSLGCMAIDLAVTKLKIEGGEKRRLYRAVLTFIVFLVLWFVLSYLLAPWLIESSYHRENIEIFNNIISDQRPLERYIRFWHIFRLRILYIVICCGLISMLFFFTTQREAESIKSGSSSWLVISSIPVFLISAFSIGLLLTEVAGSQKAFQTRLLFFNSKLIQAGHYRQAEIIVSYLGKNSIVSDAELLAIKSHLYSKANRSIDANKAVYQALEIELSSYAKMPKDSRQAQKIARLYSYAGRNDLAIKYWNEALQLSEQELNITDSKEMKFDIHFFRAMTYQQMGANNLAFIELLLASDYASNALFRHKIENGIEEILSKCQKGSAKFFRLSWEKIEQMADAHHQGNKLNCAN